MDLVNSYSKISVAKTLKTLSLIFALQQPLRYLTKHQMQLTKFVAIGLATFGINFALFHLFFSLLHFDYKIAVSFAYVITVICHFLLHRFFTFSATEQQVTRNAGKYSLMLLINYGITLAVLWIVVEVIKVSPYIGIIAATAVTASTSFFLMKYFVFLSKKDFTSNKQYPVEQGIK